MRGLHGMRGLLGAAMAFVAAVQRSTAQRRADARHVSIVTDIGKFLMNRAQRRKGSAAQTRARDGHVTSIARDTNDGRCSPPLDCCSLAISQLAYHEQSFCSSENET